MTFKKDYLRSLFAEVERDSMEEAWEALPAVGGLVLEETASSGNAGEREEATRGSPDKAEDSSDNSSPRATLDITQTGSTDSDSGSSSSSCRGGGAAEEPQTHQWRGLIRGLLQRKKSIRRSPTFPPGTSPEVTRWKLLRKLERTRTAGKNREGELPLSLPSAPPPPQIRWRPTWRSFELKELAAATDAFSSENLIGRGGHAEVYRGQLPCGQLVAVKRLTRKEAEEERVADFLSELGIIAHVNHPNAAHLIGFGVEGGLHLVLQYSPHGSLASVLHGGSKEPIEWSVRYKIADGVAEGLRYLHEGCHRRIIHRDIKASNILLTDDYRPQISDFGLAKWLPDNWPHHVVFPIEGTFGYLAPEYFMHGVVNEKTDVFAFGVLLLELITGRRAVDSSRQSLVIWAKPLLDAGNLEGLVDPNLGGSYDPREMDRAVSVASACIHHLPAARPGMNQALQVLRGESASMEAGGDELGKPALFDALVEDYSSSRYLSDLSRHRKIALEP